MPMALTLHILRRLPHISQIMVHPSLQEYETLNKIKPIWMRKPTGPRRTEVKEKQRGQTGVKDGMAGKSGGGYLLLADFAAFFLQQLRDLPY